MGNGTSAPPLPACAKPADGRPPSPLTDGPRRTKARALLAAMRAFAAGDGTPPRIEQWLRHLPTVGPPLGYTHAHCEQLLADARAAVAREAQALADALDGVAKTAEWMTALVRKGAVDGLECVVAGVVYAAAPADRNGVVWRTRDEEVLQAYGVDAREAVERHGTGWGGHELAPGAAVVAPIEAVARALVAGKPVPAGPRAVLRVFDPLLVTVRRGAGSGVRVCVEGVDVDARRLEEVLYARPMSEGEREARQAAMRALYEHGVHGARLRTMLGREETEVLTPVAVHPPVWIRSPRGQMGCDCRSPSGCMCQRGGERTGTGTGCPQWRRRFTILREVTVLSPTKPALGRTRVTFPE